MEVSDWAGPEITDTSITHITGESAAKVQTCPAAAPSTRLQSSTPPPPHISPLQLLTGAEVNLWQVLHTEEAK